MDRNIEAADLMTAALKRTKFLYKDFFYTLDTVSKKNKEKFHENVSLSSTYVWDELVKYYRKRRMSTENRVDMSRATSRINAFWHWRQHKKIYEFDEDLADMLMDQDISNLVIDQRFFTRLPFNGLCMYINSSKHQMNQCIIVYIDSMIEDELALNFSVFTMPHLTTEYIGDVSSRGMICCSEYKIKLIQDETLGNAIESISGPVDIGYQVKCMKLVNLLIYILAANSDISYKGSHIPKLTIEYIDDDSSDNTDILIVGKNVGAVI